MSVANLLICGFLLDDPICWNLLLANLVGPHPHNSLSGGESDGRGRRRRVGSDFCPRTFWVINWFCGWLMTFLLSSFLTLLEGEKPNWPHQTLWPRYGGHLSEQSAGYRPTHTTGRDSEWTLQNNLRGFFTFVVTKKLMENLKGTLFIKREHLQHFSFIYIYIYIYIHSIHCCKLKINENTLTKT